MAQLSFADLGPLEQAALRALARAELLDAPLTVAGLWRTLPGYATRLANVRAALAPGQPLRLFVVEDRDRYVLRDRSDALLRTPERLGRADTAWRELKGRLGGLGKLPFVEAVAICGPMAWGVLAADDPRCGLAIVAEGGRTGPARAAVRAWRKAAGLTGALRIAAVLDADALALTPGDATAAWWLLSLRPVVNEDALHRLWAANAWARGFFPNFSTEATGGLPEYLLSGRVDGRLAAWRRAQVADVDDGVVLTSLGRRGVTWDDLLADALDRRKAARACGEWTVDGGLSLHRELGEGATGRLAERTRALEAWTADDGRPEETAEKPSPSLVAATTPRLAPSSRRAPGRRSSEAASDEARGPRSVALGQEGQRGRRISGDDDS